MSLITELMNTLDQRSLSGIANTLGESDHSVSRGLQSAIGTVLGGLANRSDNPSLLRKILDMAPAALFATSLSNLGGMIPDSDSPLMSAGKNILSTLFGSSEGAVTRSLASGTGLHSSTASTLLAMAAPLVAGFLGRKVRDEGMNMGGLGNLLQRELPAIRGVLPAGVSDALWPREHETYASAAGATVPGQHSSFPWLAALLLLGLIPTLWWLSRGNKPEVQRPSVPSGTANRVAPDLPTPPRLPVTNSVDLRFQSGSMKLLADSNEKLREFASTVSKSRDTHVMVSGYTDSAGSAASNLRLSQARANAVKADLIRNGIAADRLTAKGFGEEDPIGDNATVAGREANRRVTVEVTNP